MKANIEIKVIDEDSIEILGVKYYAESYLKEMMDRQYSRGYNEGVRVEIHKLEAM